jgi:dolichyl-phosphate-mannose--protein O-mannosyl transferase
LITDSVLLTHDVASPYYPTNQEFTTVNQEEAAGSCTYQGCNVDPHFASPRLGIQAG